MRSNNEKGNDGYHEGVLLSFLLVVESGVERWRDEQRAETPHATVCLVGPSEDLQDAWDGDLATK